MRELRWTEEQRNSFAEASKPLIEWLSKNIHPHALVIVDSEKSELLSGEIMFVAQKEQKKSK